MKHIFNASNNAEAATRKEAWGSLLWLANQEIGNANGLTLGRVIIKSGQSNPRHAHFGCEEVLCLLHGKLRHTVGDDTYVMEPGDTLTILPGVFHNAASIGDVDADMIVAYSAGSRDFRLEAEVCHEDRL